MVAPRLFDSTPRGKFALAISPLTHTGTFPFPRTVSRCLAAGIIALGLLPVARGQAPSESEALKLQMDKLSARLSEMEKQMDQLSGVVLPEVKTTLEAIGRAKVQSDSATILVINRLNTLQNKVRILEGKAAYSDSANFEILSQLVLIENKIVTLTRSFNELYALKGEVAAASSGQKISSADYKRKYVEALGQFQSGEYGKALKGFEELTGLGASGEPLADNSQYWLGECCYSMKNYKRAIAEFQKVFEFADSDKHDDAQLKLGLCFKSAGNAERARQEFEKLLNLFPGSEYYGRAQQYLSQL